MPDSRYQSQPRHIKAYRWLRHTPKHLILGLLRVVLWAVLGARREKFVDETGFCRKTYTRRGTAKLLFQSQMTIRDIDMQHYYTVEEVFERLKA